MRGLAYAGFAALLAFVALSFAPAPDVAADTPTSVAVEAVDFSSFPVIQLSAAVLGANAKPVPNLRQVDFQVFQGERPVKALEVAQEPSGAIDMVVIIDDRSGEAEFIEREKELALRLLARLNPADQAGVTAFADTTAPLVALTADKRRAQSAIAAIGVQPGSTAAFNRGLQAALLQLEAARPHANKVVVVFSDGQDYGDVNPALDTQLKDLAREKGVTVYTVFVGGTVQTALYREITAVSGGLGVDGTVGVDDRAIDNVAGHIWDNLRPRYTLQFTSARDLKDPSEIKLAIKGAAQTEASINVCRYGGEPVMWLPALEADQKVSKTVEAAPSLLCAAGRPIKESRYFLDGEAKSTATRPPFEYRVYTDQLSRGAHSLRVETLLADGTLLTSETPFTVSGNAFNPAYLMLIAGLGVFVAGAFVVFMRRRAGEREPAPAAVSAVLISERRSPMLIASAPEASAAPFRPMAAPAAGGQAMILVVGGPGEGQTYAIAESLTFGRSPQSDVVLAGPSVSREHAVIWFDGVEYRVMDLGSTNGTKVNGRTMTESALVSGDRIEISPYAFEFRL